MERTWYVKFGDGREEGPLSEAEVRDFIAQGQLNDGDLHREGEGEWLPLSENALFGAAFKPESNAVDSEEPYLSLKETIDLGARGALHAMKAAKLRMYQAKLKKSREKMYAALGREVYKHRDAVDVPKRARVCFKPISDLETMIREIAERLGDEEE